MSPKISICFLLALVTAATGRYFNFERGFEYVYKAVANCELKKLGTFQLKSKVGASCRIYKRVRSCSYRIHSHKSYYRKFGVHAGGKWHL
jgi:hypothetical protein